MAVQAMFWVQKVTKHCVAQGNTQREVFLAPVVSPTEGNDDWSKYTPSGEIRLVVTAQPAADWFEDRLGKNISILFDDGAPRVQ